MTSADLDTRLRTAWEATQAARTARRRQKLLPVALRAAEHARRLLLSSAPGLATDADRLAALVRAEAAMNDPGVGDRLAFAREVAALRSEGVSTHLVARSAIRVGACAGPLTLPKVQACAVKLRQERLRFRASRA
jgi:hypothetical protein